MKTLEDVFDHTLQDMYFAENALTKALPKVIAAVSDSQLKVALEKHLSETKTHVTRLDEVFASIGSKAEGDACDAMQGLIKECETLMAEAPASPARQAGIVGCCQAIEHYEIARYGTLREWAKSLGHDEAHDLLTAILDQEKAADHTLTHLAVTSINKASGNARSAGNGRTVGTGGTPGNGRGRSKTGGRASVGRKHARA
jgi:ferritin-like metal-binding protein YciE